MKKKIPIVANDNYKLRLKKVMPPLDKGEEKTHCSQQHWVNLPKNKIIYT